GLIAELTSDGVGVIVSTHDLSLARDVCTQACVLASRLVALGPVDEALAPNGLARAYGASADEAIASLS
ncbi:MAG: ABC transporter ATP-binding protein, partial [Thermobifida sp.]|nr:ABC transporter ATP-binding protein [Thermobifida sp.]